MEGTPTRIAAIGDLHVNLSDRGKWAPLFKEISHQADVLLLCGDLTDTGDEEEAEILAAELASCSIPVAGVFGNHDHEKGRQKVLRHILNSNDNVHILDGESVIFGSVGVAGVRGFGGGFNKHMVSMFGEGAMKAFVQEAVDEALHLDRALARLDQDEALQLKKIAILHYSPIQETILGEPEQIYPFLGSSRLEEPLNRRQVVAAFHGHAHAGVLEGRTREGVRVFNVAKPVLVRAGIKKGYFVLEV